MDTISIEERLKDLIAYELAIPKPELDRNTVFSMLSKDSLDLLDLLVEIESEFGVSFDNYEGGYTVGEVADYLESQ